MRDLDINVGSIKLRIREYERDGSAIIFLHFGGGNLMIWQRIVPYFQDRYRLILVDLRDHGKSDKPHTGGHMDEMAHDVAMIMEHLHLERAHVVGSSLGAEVGLGMAANYPEKVISLVCDGALCSEYGPYGIWEGSAAEFEEYVAGQLAPVRGKPDRVFASAADLVEFYRQVFAKDGWWNPYMGAWQEYDAFEVSTGQFTRSWRKAAMAEYLEHYFNYRFEDYYRRVRCPVLMLATEEDMQDERAKNAMQGLCQLAPQARIVAVPGWIHPYGWLVDPEAMTQVVLEFLAEARD